MQGNALNFGMASRVGQWSGSSDFLAGVLSASRARSCGARFAMKMHQVRYFLAVARTLNFTRAAEQCNVFQPALTRAIQQLEDELSGKLLRRERNLSHLTCKCEPISDGAYNIHDPSFTPIMTSNLCDL